MPEEDDNESSSDWMDSQIDWDDVDEDDDRDLEDIYLEQLE